MHSKSSSLAWTRANHFTGSERLRIFWLSRTNHFSLFLKDPLGSRQFNYESDEESQFTQSAGARPGGQRFVRFMCLSCSIPAALLALPCALKAQPTAHYPPGLHGINAATLPPPGFYVRNYNFFYMDPASKAPGSIDLGSRSIQRSQRVRSRLLDSRFTGQYY